MKLIERIRTHSFFFLKKKFSYADYLFLTKVINSPYIRRVCYTYRYSFTQVWECAGYFLYYGFFFLFAIVALLFCPILQLFYSYWIWKAHRQEDRIIQEQYSTKSTQTEYER